MAKNENLAVLLRHAERRRAIVMTRTVREPVVPAARRAGQAVEKLLQGHAAFLLSRGIGTKKSRTWRVDSLQMCRAALTSRRAFDGIARRRFLHFRFNPFLNGTQKRRDTLRVAKVDRNGRRS